METSDTDFIENVFNPFFKDLITINYRIRSNMELTAEQKKKFYNLKYLIPIYLRILNEPKLEISDVQKDTFINHSTQSTNVHTSGTTPVTSTETNTQHKTIDSSESEDVEDETDEEGDEQVKQLTDKYLERLTNVKESKWVIVKEIIESDLNSDDDDESSNDNTSYDSNLENGDNTEEYEIIEIENDKKYVIPKYPVATPVEFY